MTVIGNDHVASIRRSLFPLDVRGQLTFYGVCENLRARLYVYIRAGVSIRQKTVDHPFPVSTISDGRGGVQCVLEKKKKFKTLYTAPSNAHASPVYE
jgi:hypothetical protein